MPLLGVYNTFWLSLVIVAIGGVIGAFFVHEAQGLRPISDEHVDDPRSYKRLLEGIDILWRDPRTALGGFVRIVNTSPQYGFFYFMPFVFVSGTSEAGFMSGGQYSVLVSLVYGANIGAVKRSVYDPDGSVRPFVSGYADAPLPNLWQP